MLWGTLRPGKAGTANGVVELLQQALTMLPAGHQVGVVRAEADFFVTRFLTFLEQQELPYIIMARLTPVLRRLVLHRLPDSAWRRVSQGIEVAEMVGELAQLARASPPHRVPPTGITGTATGSGSATVRVPWVYLSTHGH